LATNTPRCGNRIPNLSFLGNLNVNPWKLDITKKILATMRYCYTPLPVEVNEEEWRGDAEAGGVKDYIISLVYDQRKKTYKDGYLEGAMAAWAAATEGYLTKSEMQFSPDDAKIGAERAWTKYDKEET
jgi:hypothetical protein